MAGTFAYVDSSAFVKLIVSEPESAALRRELARWPGRVASTLLRTEAVRALRRSGNEHQVPNARRLFRTLHLIRIDEPLLDRAGDAGPSDLRSLEAIHLTAALSVGPDLAVAFIYDARLKRAFENVGIDVSSPN